MKLHLVSAGRGVYWVKAGIKTFFRQPLALAGLFLLFMAAISLVSMVPVVGGVLGFILLPGGTLGLMVGTQQASNGIFPKPTVLLSAFRSGRSQQRDMLILGALYAASFLTILGLSALLDGGKLARLYILGTDMSAEALTQPDFQAALLLVMALCMPLSVLFWYAPALVHWHGISPLKSLFFGLVACLRNFWAYMVYSLVWLVAFVGMAVLVAMTSDPAGSPELAAAVLLPGTLLILAVYLTSIYFTFQDSFEPSNGDTQ